MMLARMIRKVCASVVSNYLRRMHTVKPAQIVTYNAETNLCSLQPCVEGFRIDNLDTGSEALPVIEDIPVLQFGSANVCQTSPVTEGDYGIYIVAEDDITPWIANGGIVQPVSIDRFNLSDGFFIPGLFPLSDSFSTAIATDRISLRTKTGDTEISVLDDETILIKNGSGEFEMDSGGTVTINGNFTVDV